MDNEKVINSTKKHLLLIQGMKDDNWIYWAEGYVSCLANNYIIDLEEFNELIDWIVRNNK